MDKRRVKQAVIRGFLFQQLLIGAMVYRFYYYKHEWSWSFEALFSIGRMLDILGSLIFISCMVRIYLDNKDKKLITTGLFRYTRHPMYNGAVLMDLSLCLNQSYDPYFWLSALVFYASVFIAGYFQEKETFARYGLEAEEYYSKTPRIILLYPFHFFFRRPAH